MSWRRFVRRAHWDAERRAELDGYVAQEIDDGVARGLSPEAARREAYRKLGSPTLIREEIYTMNSIGWLESLWHDARFALRVLRKSPAFTLVTVLSLALGVGANTAFFELIDAVRLRTLPVARPEELVEVTIDAHGKGRSGEFNGGWPRMTYPLFTELQSRQHSLDHLFAWGSGHADLSAGGESQPANVLWVSGAFFEGLGVRPALGRLLGPADDVRGCGDPSVALGHAFWQNHFGSDSHVIGQPLQLNGATFRIAGVSEASFFGLDVGQRFDVAMPICAEPLVRAAGASQLDRRDAWWVSVMGRLPPTTPLGSVTTALAALSAPMMQATLPTNYVSREAESYKAFTLRATSVAGGLSSLRTDYADPLLVLFVISGAVLLIACGNLASLMLARASVRAREMAVRLAIGASRPRLVRQLMVESLLLAVAGAVAGGILAGGLSRALVSFVGQASPGTFVDLHVDLRVLVFTGGLALVTCIACGLAPALRSTNQAPSVVMRSSGRGLTESGGGRFGLRRALVVGQLALSLVLATAALFFGVTLRNLTQVDPGFDARGVLEADFDFRRVDVPRSRLLAFETDFLDRVRRLAGVTSASSTNIVPLGGSVWNETLVVDGKELRPFPNVMRVSTDFFTLMHVPLAAGRVFSASDIVSTPPVAVVTESFARTYFHNDAPLGRQFTFLAPPNSPVPSMTVVGIVKDIKYADIKDPVGPVIFLADTQETDPDPRMTILMRTSGDVASAVTSLARTMHPRILVSFSKLDEAIAKTMVRERLMASLSALFGLLAGVLAAVGLYGVISYSVASRRIEVGIRLALGAERREVVRMFLKESAVLTGIGLVVGSLLALAAARSATTLFYGVTATTPEPFVTAFVALAAVAIVASFVPAYRASRLEPTQALRQD